MTDDADDEAWYRTLVAMGHEDYEEAMSEDLSEQPALGLEELRNELGLDVAGEETP